MLIGVLSINLALMFYLVIENLGVQQCIFKNITNIFTDNMSIDCLQSLGLPADALPFKSLSVFCNGNDDDLIPATVYKGG